jgi:hypothetical protein
MTQPRNLIKAGHVARMGEIREACRNLVENPKCYDTPLGGLVCTWKFNIKINIKQILGEDMSCIQLSQNVIHQ